MSRLKHMVRLLGWKDGLSFYLKAKSKMGDISAAKWKTSFRLRPGTTDFDTYEHVFVQKQYDFIINFEPTTIIDGGANIGMSAIFFALKYPRARIYSYEVNKENFDLLKYNTRDFPQVTAICKGIWSESGYLKVVDKGLGYNSFTVEKIDQPVPGSIEATSIPDIMREVGVKNIDIVKLDIEGSEKNVFENNFESWLPDTKVVAAEIHDRMQPGSSKAVFSAISKYNFSCELKGENLVFFNQELLSQA